MQEGEGVMCYLVVTVCASGYVPLYDRIVK